MTSNIDSSSGKQIVEARQDVNPLEMQTYSEANNKPGIGVMHAVTEAYQGALISQSSGVSSPMAGVAGSVYPAAHNHINTTTQPGTINQVDYFYGSPAQTGDYGSRSIGAPIGRSTGTIDGKPVPGTVSTVPHYFSNGVLIR